MLYQTQNRLITFTLARLQEASTWRGIVLLLTSTGLAISPDALPVIITVGTGVSGLIAVLSADNRA